MRVGASEERHVRETRKAQIVDERAPPLQQPLHIRPRYALADVALVELRARRVEGKLGLHLPITDSIASTIAW